MDNKKVTFHVVQFMTDAGVKLRLKPVPLATAAMLYHKFCEAGRVKDYDPYLIGATCLYLASKVEEDHLKLRDVVNVCYRCKHPDQPALDMGTTYSALKDSIAQCELFILRQLQFRVNFSHPHKYLLHYIDSIEKWLSPDQSSVKSMVAETSWALLRDSYHGDLCLRYQPNHIAVSVLYLAFQCYGVEVPCSKDAGLTWWEAFVENIKINDIRTIITEIIDLYEFENVVGFPTSQTGSPASSMEQYSC